MRRLGTALLMTSLLAAQGGMAKEEVPLPKDLPPFGPDRPLPVPTIDESKTAEGLTVWLVPRPGFPKITAVLVVHGGTAADAKGQEGLAELLAETVRAGTKTRTSRKIAEELQVVGGEIGSSASDDAITISTNGLATGSSTLLSILADVARNASFPEGEVALAKENALQNLELQESTPEFIGNKILSKAIFGEHPYHITSLTRDVIGKATPEVLRKEHARRFHPARALLVVAGDFDAKALSAQVQQSFGGWKTSGTGAEPTPEAPKSTPRRILLADRPGSVQSLLMVGRPAVKATDPSYHALTLANTIFGGAFSSRLVRNIREDKGYTYSPGADVSTLARGGTFVVRADVRNAVTGASLNEIFYELDRMATTEVSDEELSRAKRLEAGVYLLRNQIQSAVAGSLARNWVRGLPSSALGEYVSRINAVTKSDVRTASREYLSSSRHTIVCVGDAKEVKGDLELFGTVTSAD